MTDINSEDFILALPDNSIIKTGLLALGTAVDSLKPTEELFSLISAYETVQVEFNTGTMPDINTVSPLQILNSQVVDTGIDRTIRRTLTFKQHLEPLEVSPLTIL
ncbi:MAG TPA: hypothetical protein V6D21_05905 [Candidatus Obscuribacterales bacterium]